MEKQQENKENSLKRRNFFSLLSKSFLGVTLLSIFPLNALAKKQAKEEASEKSSVKVKINPLAVKRVK